MFRFWLCLTSAVFLAGFCGANYCRDANLCCPGRDSSCVVQKAHQNAIIEDLTDKPCYCDHACLKLGDCCPDFRETCGVLDCEVSAWGEWSECDTQCGSGSMERTRQVLQAPAHGGRHCPTLLQRRACQARRGCAPDSDVPQRECDTQCGSGSMERTRQVLQAPAHGGRHCPTLLQRRACQARRGCAPDSDVPQREETAMILPGSLSVSRHSNDTVDIRKNLRLRNPDDPESNSHREYCVQFEVIKVSKACHADSDYKALREGATVCVSCETAALRRDLQWRCSGHGVARHGTRFYALVAPHCRGKWIRVRQLDRHAECCTSPDFIFV